MAVPLNSRPLMGNETTEQLTGYLRRGVILRLSKAVAVRQLGRFQIGTKLSECATVLQDEGQLVREVDLSSDHVLFRFFPRKRATGLLCGQLEIA